MPDAPPPLVRSRWLRGLLVGTGFLFVGLAALGVVLPLLPTTPFLLVAASCFAGGSHRFYEWLLGNRRFGPILRDWRQRRCVSLRVKVVSITLLALTLGSSIVFVVDDSVLRFGLAAIGLGVVVLLLRLRTCEQGEPVTSTTVKNADGNR